MIDPSLSFNALWVEETPGGGFARSITRRTLGDLPAEDVLVRVQYSSLNYKDALSASGNRGVTRHYPHTPGIDAVGVVEESTVPEVQPGQAVIVSGPGLGTSLPGGFGQFIRVPADWIRRLPAGFSPRDSMAYGTAGFTAAYGVYRLLQYGLRPEQGEVLVTGATGGVGAFAVALLAREGFQVVAATGKPDQEGWLRSLGASAILSREELNDASGKGLLSARWAGGYDTVGGNYLATALKTTKHSGVFACCGNTASAELHTTVFPFILRGVALLGIDATQVPAALSQELWDRMAGPWKLPHLEAMTHEVSLSGLETEIERILHGGQTGRVIVNLQEETAA